MKLIKHIKSIKFFYTNLPLLNGSENSADWPESVDWRHISPAAWREAP